MVRIMSHIQLVTENVTLYARNSNSILVACWPSALVIAGDDDVNNSGY